VIKWGEFRDGDAVFEAFLPEHEGEAQEWLLRASRMGHILKERRIGLTWPPRFGPDQGDVVRAEVELEALMATVAALPVPGMDGAYTPGPCMVADPEPILHASLQALLDDYLEAIASLGVTGDQARNHLGLPEGMAVRGLFPMAITKDRDGRMNRVIALAKMTERDERFQRHSVELLAAILTEDIAAIRYLLAKLGFDVEATSSAPPAT